MFWCDLECHVARLKDRDLVAFYFRHGLAMQLQQNDQQRRQSMTEMQGTKETDFFFFVFLSYRKHIF